MAKAEKLDNKGKKEEVNPKVTVFGETVASQEKPQNDAGSGVWGVFLIFVGLLLLMNVLGILTWDFWQNIWQFWPVLLVLLGFHILLGNNIVSKIVLTLLALVIFGAVIVWGLEQVNSSLLQFVPNDFRNFVNSLEDIRK